MVLVVAAGLIAGGWLYVADRGESAGEAGETTTAAAKATAQPAATEVPDGIAHAQPTSRPGRGHNGDAVPLAAATPGGAASRAAALLASGREALRDQDWLTARARLNAAFRVGVEEPQRAQLLGDLQRVADETILSPLAYEGDAFTASYLVQSGDTLGKIAAAHHVTTGLLARINGLRNINIIRVGQNLKVIEGPFHAIVEKRSYALDVYIGDTPETRVFVRRFRVGLGAGGATPRGRWRVKNKLRNPEYYPPRGGRIIPADDPENPLGERWIGLLGLSGAALGQQRYGIHGTIEPDSIGQDASLGCIRMYNEDVAVLYDLLVVRHSTVEVR